MWEEVEWPGVDCFVPDFSSFKPFFRLCPAGFIVAGVSHEVDIRVPEVSCECEVVEVEAEVEE